MLKLNKRGEKLIVEWLWPELLTQGASIPPLDYNTIHEFVIPKLKKEDAWMSFDSGYDNPWGICTIDETWEGKGPYHVLLQYLGERQTDNTGVEGGHR